jgi:hypothetical protein
MVSVAAHLLVDAYDFDLKGRYNMKRIITIVLPVLMGSLLTCVTLWAQATAQIGGAVRDPSGAVLPGVEVTATQTDTGITRNTVTNETGSYVLSNLPLGPYRVEAVLPGFRTYVQTGIVLQVNSSSVINPVLQIGQLTESVEVQANAAMVETRTVGIGQLMENQRILELPLNGRNAAELVLLGGAAVLLDTTGNRGFPDRLVISSAGGMGFGSAYSLDGIAHYDPYDGQALPLPFPDALEEFKVETSGLSAQHGRGSSVGAVTKSGTNEFHGSLFEFLRNDLFNARSYFAPVGSTLKRNQFGGTIGGPIARNKVFFFGGYQGTIVRQDPSDVRAFVPTAAMMAGDFTGFASPACNGRQVTLKTPFNNNRIEPALFSPAAVKIAGRLPKTDNPCGEIVFGRRSDRNDWQSTGKIDYQASNQHSLFGRHVYNYNEQPHPLTSTPDNVLNSDAAGFENHAQAFTLGSTYLIGPSLVNAFRLGVSRVNVQRVAVDVFSASDVGVLNHYTYVPHFITLTVSGGFNVGGRTRALSTFRTTFYQIADDVSLTSGTHQVSFGGNLAYGRSNAYANANSPGIFTVNGQDTGLGLADFLTGKLSQYRQGAPNTLFARQTQMAFYGQDVWKVVPRLSLNYGLRWAPNLPMKDMRRPVSGVMHFHENLYRQGIKSKVFKNAPAGMVYPGDPSFELSDNSVYHANWLNLGPRVGLAWDVQGDARTSLRASYGLSYDEFPLQMRQGNSIGQPPWGSEVILDNPIGGLDNPWQGVPGGNPFPTTLGVDAVFPASGAFQSQPYKVLPTYNQSWNLTVQRQVGMEWLFSGSYLGSQTTHTWAQIALNPGIYFAGSNCTLPNGQFISGVCSTTRNTNQRRRLTQLNAQEGTLIAEMGEYDFGGTQSYNAMLISAQRRPVRGMTLTGNYTFAHCLGDFGGRGIRGVSLSANETFQDNDNRRLDRSNCDMDVRHMLNLTAVAETPQFANPTMRMLGTGWRLSGIYRRSSGAMLNVVNGVDRSLTGILDQRPNQVLRDLYEDRDAGPMSRYLNPAAFALPDLGTRGNIGRNIVQGPWTWQFDTALSRVFRFRENQRLEFRAEAYNLTNSFRPGNPTTNLSEATFGQIRTSDTPRIMQFALKYVF